MKKNINILLCSAIVCGCFTECGFSMNRSSTNSSDMVDTSLGSSGLLSSSGVLAYAQRYCVALKNSYDALLKEKEELSNKYWESVGTNNAFKGNIENLQSEKKKLQDDYEKVLNEKIELNQKIEKEKSWEELYNQIKVELSTEKQNVDGMAKELENLKTENAQLSEKNNSLSEEIKRLGSELSTEKQNVEKKTNELWDLNTRDVQLSEKNNSLSEKIERLEKEIAEKDNEILSLKKEMGGISVNDLAAFFPPFNSFENAKTSEDVIKNTEGTGVIHCSEGNPIDLLYKVGDLSPVGSAENSVTEEEA